MSRDGPSLRRRDPDSTRSGRSVSSRLLRPATAEADGPVDLGGTTSRHGSGRPSRGHDSDERPTAGTPNRGPSVRHAAAFAGPGRVPTCPVRAPPSRVRRHRTDTRCGARLPAGRGPTGAIVRPARTSGGDRTLPPHAVRLGGESVRSRRTRSPERRARRSTGGTALLGSAAIGVLPRRDMGPGLRTA